MSIVLVFHLVTLHEALKMCQSIAGESKGDEAYSVNGWIDSAIKHKGYEREHWRERQEA